MGPERPPGLIGTTISRLMFPEILFLGGKAGVSSPGDLSGILPVDGGRGGGTSLSGTGGRDCLGTASCTDQNGCRERAFGG